MRVLYVNHTAAVSGAEHSLLSLLSGLPGDVEPVLAAPRGRLTEEAAALGVPPVSYTSPSPRDYAASRMPSSA
jgi:hypothetical protein